MAESKRTSTKEIGSTRAAGRVAVFLGALGLSACATIPQEQAIERANLAQNAFWLHQNYAVPVYTRREHEAMTFVTIREGGKLHEITTSEEEDQPVLSVRTCADDRMLRGAHLSCMMTNSIEVTDVGVDGIADRGSVHQGNGVMASAENFSPAMENWDAVMWQQFYDRQLADIEAYRERRTTPRV